MNWETKYQTTKYSNGDNTCEYIVLHHTGSTASDEAIVNYLCYNPAQVSCHYVIGRRGEIYKIAEDNKITWHAGKSYRDGRSSLNKYSIGIEIHSDGYDFTDAQRKSVRELVSFLKEKYILGTGNILTHQMIAPDRKRDVGDNFWNTQYKTFKEYQDSYGDISKKEKTLREQILKLNGQLRDETSNLELRQELHRTNAFIRSLGGT